MRIMVVGAGRTGAEVLKQLKKNPNVTAITVDAREDPFAVREGIIESVDHLEALTPLNLDYLLKKIKPDLVLMTRGASDLGLGSALGMDLLSESLKDEMAAIADVPMIHVASSG